MKKMDPPIKREVVEERAMMKSSSSPCDEEEEKEKKNKKKLRKKKARSRFSLETEDGLIVRERELTDNEKRRKLLGVITDRCRHCSMMFYHIPVKGKDDGPVKLICHFCSYCITCGEPVLDCECKATRPTKMKCDRKFRRVIYQICDGYGWTSSLYHRLVEGGLN
jgi:hypothetical protein